MPGYDELTVAAGLAANPGEALPYAWSTLRPSDFEDDGYRWLFGLLVETWHRSGGDFAPGPHYRPLIAHWYAREFSVPKAIGFAWLEELEAAALPNVAFRFHADRLAARGAVRRTRDALGHWYTMISNAGSGRGGAGGAPVAFKGALSARNHLAGLLRDVRAAVRRCPVAPEGGSDAAGREFSIGW